VVSLVYFTSTTSLDGDDYKEVVQIIDEGDDA
jgi:hypothetical protein